MSDDSPITGPKFKAMISAGARRLESNKNAVNALNVFPVPDGDTGTNMCLTVAAAVREIEKVTSPSLGETVNALSLGSLMGARGNSGVILSQLFRGMGKSLQDHRSATPLQWAWAMQEGVDTAYKAVMKPVEGTMLTVAREMAKVALPVAKKGASLEEVMEATVARARDVLARTPDMLPVLKQAGVVDAGGMGLLCLMEGALLWIRGEEVVPPPAAEAGAGPATAAETGAASSAQEIEFTYDTQLLIRGSKLAVDRIRTELEPFGDSLLVVGDPHVVKVHVHTNDPHRVLAQCISHGEILEASVENMREQHEAVQRARQAAASPDEAFAAGASGPGNGSAAPAAAARSSSGAVDYSNGLPAGQLLELPRLGQAQPAGPGVVVVASGKGLEDIFRNLGADVVVSGGQTMNPSTEDILRAIETIRCQEVLVLPNNGNILMAAKQTIDLTSKDVFVVPTRSIPQGISALVALNRSVGAEKNQARMEQALRRVRSGEVTWAVRDSKYKDIDIHAGDCIGLLDDEIVTVGPDSLSVLGDLVRRMVGDGTEIVTVFVGEDVGEDDADRARKLLAGAAPGHEIEIHRGGQPLYNFLVSVE